MNKTVLRSDLFKLYAIQCKICLRKNVSTTYRNTERCDLFCYTPMAMLLGLYQIKPQVSIFLFISDVSEQLVNKAVNTSHDACRFRISQNNSTIWWQNQFNFIMQCMLG